MSTTKKIINIHAIAAILIALVCVGLSGWSLVSAWTPLVDKFLTETIDQYDAYCPTVTIQDGEASIREKVPYFVDFGETSDEVVVVIDTKENRKSKALEYLKDAKNGAVLLKDRLILKNRGQFEPLPLEDFPDMEIKTSSLHDLKDKHLPLLERIGLIIAIVYYLIVKSIQILILALIPLVAAQRFSIDLSYGQSVKIAAFCLAPPVLFDVLLNLSGFHLPVAWLFYSVIYVVFLILAAADLIRGSEEQPYSAEGIHP
jgi:hypothetical protein